MTVLDAPLRTCEFLAVDVETNGCAGDACELTEVGTVLVGGGELHERWSSLVAARAPLSAGIQRFTGISQAMVDLAPAPADVLPRVSERLNGRVLVAHSARFDRGVLAGAYARAGLEWPDPPVLCTVALARRLAPLVRRRGLGPLAAALGLEVEGAHRALVDAETCARVFCALFPKLCANAATVRDAVALLAPRRRRRSSRRLPPGRLAGGAPAPAAPLDFSALPNEPGVYVFRDGAGRPLYVGKSTRVRTRARSHFAPGAEAAGWTAHAALVDHRETESELGALVLENRLIKQWRPPGNVVLKRSDAYVYLRARLDIAYPILEVASEPAAGRAINVGPLRGEHAARELADHLTSLFALRHCGRRLPRREHPSAYGQMGRCLSPCLNDLDPNLYRARLDAALRPFTGAADGREALLALVEARMREESDRRHYERAATLRRRRDRLETILDRLGGQLRATHAAPRLVLARHPRDAGTAGAAPGSAAGRFDAFWILGGRVADWGPLPTDAEELSRRTALALGARPAAGPDSVPPEAVHELRIVATWLESHPDAPVLPLDPPPGAEALAAFLRDTVRLGDREVRRPASEPAARRDPRVPASAPPSPAVPAAARTEG